MSSRFGRSISVEVFGESHGESIGAVVEGLPAGFEVDLDQLDAFIARRRPGGLLATRRHEEDAPRFLSGIRDGVLTGSPLCVVIDNHDARSRDYEGILETPRPSHADYTAYVRYGGFADMRGGGHFSGRLTAPLCLAGGIAIQVLEQEGVFVGAHIERVGKVLDPRFDPVKLDRLALHAPAGHPLPVIDTSICDDLEAVIGDAARSGDSIGGIIECGVVGMPAGAGDPMFDGVENLLSRALFAIPAVKGVEFGVGFDSASMHGSEFNDAFRIVGDEVVTRTNNSGGILGGVSNGMPIVFRCAVKPTPSISIEQDTVDIARWENTTMVLGGRHDPCIALRAVPVVEAVTALVMLDLLYRP